LDILHLSFQCHQLRQIYRFLFFKNIVQSVDVGKFYRIEGENRGLQIWRRQTLERKRSEPMRAWRRKLLLAPFEVLRDFLKSKVCFQWHEDYNTERDIAFLLLTGLQAKRLPGHLVAESFRNSR